MINSMLGILCRFRKGRVAVACDAEKMFYNFHVSPADRDYLRFLRKDVGAEREYRMVKHLFGRTSEKF